jgi:MFS family permease
MKRFFVIWFGQFVSLIGSGLTVFALAVWVYRHTESASRWTLVLFCSMLPMVLLSPVAGVIIDRIGQRWSLVLSGIGGSFAPLILAVMMALGKLHLFHIYLAVLIAGAFTSLQWPAYTSVVSYLVAKRDFTRANGLVQFAQAGAFIAAPMLGAFMITRVRLQAIFLIDVASFAVAIGTLLIMPATRPAAQSHGEEDQQGGFSYGWKYILARPGLLSLLIFFAITNFIYSLGYSLLPPLVLARHSGSILGTVQALMGVGGLAGGLLLAAWRGPQRRIEAVLISEVLLSLGIGMAGIWPALAFITAGGFLIAFSLTAAMIWSQAIWQSKVDPACQGRVFAVRYMIAWCTIPLAYATAGPLAEHVFQGGGGILGRLIPFAGADGQIGGIRVVLTCGALMNLASTVWAYLNPRLRRVETELPDTLLLPMKDLALETP